MRVIYILLHSLFILSLSLFADDPEINTLASTEGLVNSLIAGHVCPISGEFVYSQTDLVVPGPTPLTVQRSYRSRNISWGHLKKSWQLFEPLRMLSGVELSKNENLVRVPTSMGAELTYVHYKGDESKKLLVHSMRIPYGLTNCSSNYLSGQTNIKNNKLVIHTQDPLCKYKGELTAGDGTKRFFYHSYKTELSRVFDLYEEHKPNRTKKIFQYNKDFTPKEISICNQTNSITYASLNLELISTNTITSSNGKKTKYNYTKHKYKDFNNQEVWDWFISSVESDQHPNESYEYKSGVRPKHFWMLSKINKPDLRYLEIEYYRDGINTVGDREEKLPKGNYSIDRVMTLKAPVGHDATPVITHRFFYHYTRDENNYILKGSTEVRDALNRHTDYFYNTKNRLSAIAEWSKDNVYRWERYHWGKELSHDDGNLIAKYVQLPNGPYINGSFFIYDKKGNVLERREYGNVTGKERPPLELDKEGKPLDNGAEYYSYFFQYNEDNRIIEAREKNGKNTLFTYVPNTSAIASKILRDNENVITREYYEYDENLFLLKKTIDDGRSLDKGNNTGVTCTKITRYKPRQSFPFGLNEEVKELYLDRETGKERLLHRVVNKHNNDGLLLQQDHYDSKNIFQYTTFTDWDKYGNKIRETDPIGQVTVWEYDANNNLILTQGPNWDYKTEYSYDFSNRLIRITETHPDGVFITSYAYDYVGNRIKSTDCYGNDTIYKYDDLNRLIKVTYPSRSTDKSAPCERFAYDILNNIIQITDKNGYVTNKTCNAQGNPLTTQYSDGTYESNIYSKDGTLTKSSYRNGSYSIFTRDTLGRIKAEVLYGSTGDQLSSKNCKYSSFNLVESTDPEGIVTTYTYDDAGRLLSKKRGNSKTTYEYDSLSRIFKEIHWITDSSATVSTFTYDALGRVVSEGTEDLSGKVLASTRYTYNTFGQRTSTTIGSSTTQVIYNTHQQPIQLIDAAGNVTNIIYDYNYYNDTKQNVLKITSIDPMGNQTIQIKDVHGKISIEQELNSIGTLLSQHQNFYDLDDNLISVRHDNIVNGKITDQQFTNWMYNSNRQLTQLTEGAETNLQRIRTYSYNDLGQKEKMVKPDGTIITYTYDAKSRLSTLISSDKTVSYAFSYNKNDQILTVEDVINKATTTRNYDAQGRLKHETLANGLTIDYQYDNLDRKTQITLPDRTTIQYTYDELDLTQITRKGKTPFTHQYAERDTHGNILQSKLPFQAGIQTFSYDILQRQISNTHRKRSQTVPSKGFDLVGNLLRLDQIDELGKLSSSFTYNDLYQLTSEKTSENHSYSYDSLDNRRKIDNSMCKLNSLNQLVGQDSSQYKYDLNGNLYSKTVLGICTQYKFDALNRLIQVKSPLITHKFTYDPFDRRMTKDDETYAYDGQNEIAVYKHNICLFQRILGESLEAEIGGAVAIETPSQTYIPLHDHLGNVVTLLSATGNVIKTYRYTAFGTESTLDTNDNNPWRFASKHYDSETGFIYFGRRYYDPSTSRWVSPDPDDYNDGPNLYAYVHNTPLTNYDAYGLIGLPAWNPCLGMGMGGYSLYTNDLLARNCAKKDWNKGISSSINSINETLHNPNVQGALLITGGAFEAGAGAAMTLWSSGASSTLGWPMMAHGADHFITGCRTLYTQKNHQTATSTLFQKAGMSENNANLADFGLSLGNGLLGAYAGIQHAKNALSTFSIMKSGSVMKPQMMDPHSIRFSQDSINSKFLDGRTVEGLIEGLRNGTINSESIPPIRVIIRDGVYHSIDNRRLYACQQANVKVSYEIVNEADLPKRLTNRKRFSTNNNGVSVEIRKSKIDPNMN